jgi:rhodanese-related sulfurtransferase
MSIAPSLVSIGELQHLLATDPLLSLIDVRTPAEFAQVHIPQARNVPLDRLHPDALIAAGTVSRGKPVYLVCQTDTRSKIAASRFSSAGHTHAIVVDGGTAAWHSAALPLIRGTSRVISLERQVRIAAGSLVVIGAALGWFVNHWFFGLSAFVGAGLVFAGITDICGLGLLLARLPWNQRAG